MTGLSSFSPERILVCQLRQIGDVLLTTPSIRLLHERYPAAAIDVFTEKKCVPVLENNPHVRRVWALDKKALPNFLAELRYYARIAAENYDLVVDFQQLPRCRFVTLMSRARVRLSYPPPWYNRLLYTHWATPVHGYSGSYRASILAPLGIVWNGQGPEMFLTEKEKGWARDYLAACGLVPGTYVTLDPTHRRSTRLWPARHYGAMIDQVHAARPALRFFILYGPGEEAMVREVLKGAKEIIFAPDQYLAAYVAEQTGRSFITWHGFCPTHAKILPEDVEREKALHPNAVFIAHPECRPAVTHLADKVASTEGMCRYVQETPATEIIVGTEVGIIHRMKKENPEKVFYPVSELAVCPNMKRTTLEKVLWSLEDNVHEVNPPAEIARRAFASIERMVNYRP